jgi:hypothetical protein
MSAYQQVIQEITQALKESGIPLTSAQLLDRCPTAIDSREVSKLIYDLKRKNLVEDGPTTLEKHPKKTYKLIQQSEETEEVGEEGPGLLQMVQETKAAYVHQTLRHDAFYRKLVLMEKMLMRL